MKITIRFHQNFKITISKYIYLQDNYKFIYRLQDYLKNDFHITSRSELLSASVNVNIDFTCPFHLFTLFKIHRLIWNAQTRASKVTARSAAHWLLRTNGAAARSSAWPPLLAILQMPANRHKKTILQGIYTRDVAFKKKLMIQIRFQYDRPSQYS